MKYLKILKNLFLALITILAILVIILFPEASSAGALSGMHFCADMLIPAVFPFVFLSSWIVNSGLAKKLNKLCSKICSLMFFLPGSAAAVIVMGLIGGYPAGAKGIGDLFENKLIDKNEAQRMSFFLFGAGPAFIINIIGIKFLKNEPFAYQILLAQTLSSILIGIFLGIYSRTQKQTNFKNLNKKIKLPNYEKQENMELTISEAITKSCESTAVVVINMCALVVLFSIIISFINKLNFENNCQAFVGAILEVTQGCAAISKIGGTPALISVFIAFGGFCVHCQILSILKKIKISYFKFLLARLAHSAIAFFTTFLLTQNTRIQPVINIQTDLKLSAHICGSLALFLCCVYLLYLRLPERKAVG
ncbi:MAG: hypothetical protein LBK29_03115 [Oscillospiraceae bacterium]|jgi:sporulation integral membrane protein YlbJ|nr:hypothetical protein [Oscillospiraceae bacterium]